MSHQIQLWRDDTSNPEEPVYCVSLCSDDCEEVRCLATYAEVDKPDAWIFAKDAAQRMEIPAVEIDKHGQELRRWIDG